MKEDPRGAHSAGVLEVGKPTAMRPGHFKLISETLAAHKLKSRADEPTHSKLVEIFADSLAKTNRRFDRQRFIKEAGG